MQKIHADYKKNRLYITYKGFVEYKDIASFVEETEAIFNKLQSGFGVITNLLEVKSIDDEVRVSIADAMKVVQKAGIGHAIRVIPHTPSGEMNALLFDKKSASVGYISHVVYSLEDAEKLLDKLERDGN